jgi:hypothetical protein
MNKPKQKILFKFNAKSVLIQDDCHKCRGHECEVKYTKLIKIGITRPLNLVSKEGLKEKLQ